MRQNEDMSNRVPATIQHGENRPDNGPVSNRVATFIFGEGCGETVQVFVKVSDCGTAGDFICPACGEMDSVAMVGGVVVGE